MNEEPSVTKADLARVAELDAKATPGPWIAHLSHHHGWELRTKEYDLASGVSEENAELAAAYRTLTPRLARELAAARAAIKVAHLLAVTMSHSRNCSIGIGMRESGERYEAVPCNCGLTDLRAALTLLNTHTHE